MSTFCDKTEPIPWIPLSVQLDCPALSFNHRFHLQLKSSGSDELLLAVEQLVIKFAEEVGHNFIGVEKDGTLREFQTLRTKATNTFAEWAAVCSDWKDGLLGRLKILHDDLQATRAKESEVTRQLDQMRLKLEEAEHERTKLLQAWGYAANPYPTVSQGSLLEDTTPSLVNPSATSVVRAVRTSTRDTSTTMATPVVVHQSTQCSLSPLEPLRAPLDSLAPRRSYNAEYLNSAKLTGEQSASSTSLGWTEETSSTSLQHNDTVVSQKFVRRNTDGETTTVNDMEISRRVQELPPCERSTSKQSSQRSTSKQSSQVHSSLPLIPTPPATPNANSDSSVVRRGSSKLRSLGSMLSRRSQSIQ